LNMCNDRVLIEIPRKDSNSVNANDEP